MASSASPLAALSPSRRTNAAAPLAPALWQRDEAVSSCTACSTTFSISNR